MKALWTWSGTFFGHRDGDNLWTHDGYHVGRFHGDEVYGSDGRYLGEIKNGDRLIACLSKKNWQKGGFSPYASRVGFVPYVDYVGYVMRKSVFLRRIFMKSFILLCLLLLLGTSALAEERIMAFGAGLESCGAWLDLKTDNGRLERMQWIYGYLIGRNYGTRKSQARYTDPQAMGAFLDMYCRNNPLHSLFQAGNALLEETGGPKAKHAWKK